MAVQAAEAYNRGCRLPQGCVGAVVAPAEDVREATLLGDCLAGQTRCSLGKMVSKARMGSLGVHPNNKPLVHSHP